MNAFEIRTPDPGVGWRLVRNEVDDPNPYAEFWSDAARRWIPRHENCRYEPYCNCTYYRVPDKAPVLGLPDIKVCEDQWFNEQYEQGRPEAVVVWMVGTIGAFLVFLLGVAVGRWTA
ncbi:MAG: hypothetical protein JNL58_04285 [Planctomyces sp.]|nr:hypothetical protein [Planctomyces sp.]